MLCQLRVKNLALIEHLDLLLDDEEGNGLIVLTGETGAGKSIMLRAIQLLSGCRSSAEWIRSGADSCEVEALFEVNQRHHRFLSLMENSGLSPDQSLLIKRQLRRGKASRYYVNGSLATGKIVASLTAELLSIAGQHDQQQLLQKSVQLDYLDTLGELWPERLAVEKQYLLWQEQKDALLELQQKEQEKAQRQDFLRFQLDEISEAAPQEREDETLAAEKKRLKNSQALIGLSQDSYRLLSVEIQEGLVRLRQSLNQIYEMDEGAAKLVEELNGFTFLAEDYIPQLRAYKDSLEVDPYRLDEVSERLDILTRLKRKYGQTLPAVLAFAQQCEQELQLMASLDEEIGQRQQQLAKSWQLLAKLATDLSGKRKKTARMLEQQLSAELESLSFSAPRFQVLEEQISREPEALRITGWDRIEFCFSANPGEAPKPLAKTASGGELSRLMLAMKSLLARKDMVETVIFDEVDSGMSGEAAEAVARKIRELASHHQVICITHLPQIAARGGLHFQVNKMSKGERTITRVYRLDGEQRVVELVRMLAGDSATQQTRAWAEELLATNLCHQS